MDSTSADAATSARTYYLYRDARGTAHMADRAGDIPANAKQLQKVTIPAKDQQTGLMSQLKHGAAVQMPNWVPGSVKANLERTHMTWHLFAGAIVLLFFFIRSSAFRSLLLKVTLPLVVLALGIGGFMTFRNRHGGAPVGQGLAEAQHDADAMRRGFRQQDRIMEKIDASNGQAK